jgi:hypothetical protein
LIKCRIFFTFDLILLTMINRYLFPHRYKIVGLVILLPSMLLAGANFYSKFTFKFLDTKAFIQTPEAKALAPNENFNFTDEAACIGLTIGLILVSFSKEKVEDEQIATTRLESLQWSVYCNYAILMLAVIFTYGMTFFNILVWNMFTLLFCFLIRFNYILYSQKFKGDET